MELNVNFTALDDIVRQDACVCSSELIWDEIKVISDCNVRKDSNCGLTEKVICRLLSSEGAAGERQTCPALWLSQIGYDHAALLPRNVNFENFPRLTTSPRAVPQ